MFFTAFLIATIQIFSTVIPRYETITLSNPNTNGLFAASEEKTVQIKLLDVPNIYEVRDYDNVEKNMDLNVYSNDVILSKLQPRTTISTTNIDITPFTAYDIKDIYVNPVDVNYANLLDLDNIHSLVVDGYDINALDVNGLNVNGMNVNEIEVVVNQSVYDYLDNLKEETQYRREYTKYGYEKAAYLKDLDALEDNLRWTWISVLKDNKTNNIAFKPAKIQRKIAAEIRYVKDYDRDLLDDNLDFLKDHGYDSILFRFDTSENHYDMEELIKYVKYRGFAIYLSYVGLDNQKPSWNPFCWTYYLQSAMSRYCPLAEGIFLNWRSTSSHVKLLPIEFFNYLCKTARDYNSEILIYGEIFYGKIDYLGKTQVVCTCPENVSGVLINNMGYVGYNQAYIVNKLFRNTVKNYNRLHKVGQVIGCSPYYCSKQKLDITLNDEYKFKAQVENNFKKVDCSTITFIHDGVDDNYVIDKTYDTDDNILTDKKISQ